MSNSTPHFKTRARLLCQLGEQLIKSESIALLELVKNAYDADATICSVRFNRLDDKKSGAIIIKDDGCGMDYDTLSNVWLEVGADFKSKLKSNGTRSPKYNRLPLGEKGIGRFGIHRLGKKIILISRRENCKECVLTIDWDEIEKTDYIENLPIKLTKRVPKIFKDASGTKIIIKGLKKQWTRGSLRDVARQINTLNSPFEEKDSFKVQISVDNNWLDNLSGYEEIKNMYLSKFKLTIKGNKITDFWYQFRPYDGLNKVKAREVNYDAFSPYARMVRKKNKKKDDYEDIDISKYEIGEIKMEGILFDLDNKTLECGLPIGRKSLKDYLSKNGGVRVFRDNMRVWNYGESDNDWLELDAKRINRPSFKLSNKLILASIYLDGEKSSDLIEKSNREGFVDNEAYQEFQSACSYAIDKVEFYRNEDKKNIRNQYSPRRPDKPVIDSIDEIKELVRKKINDEILQQDLYKKLDKISEDYTRITENLMKSAGAGLNLIMVLHQIEKIVKNLKSDIANKSGADNFESEVALLSKLVTGYALLVRNSEIQGQSATELLDYALDNMFYRFEDHKIEVIKNYQNKQKNVNIVCSDNLFVNALMNLLDNSIWWLVYSKIKNKKIFLDFFDNDDGFITIVVADNGPGFSISRDELGEPFVTAKPPGLGIGIGLHLTKEIMQALKGHLNFPDPEDFDIPKEFFKGAIVALSFKKG